MAGHREILIFGLLLLTDFNFGQSINIASFQNEPPADSDVDESPSDDPDYGITWFYFPDGFGELQVAFLMPNEEYAQNSDQRTVDMDSIEFTLYRQNGVLQSTSMTNGLETVFTEYDNTRWTKFIVHGWKSSPRHPAMANLRDQYLRNEDVNVIEVNWRKIAASQFYVESVWGVPSVGQRISGFIDYMVQYMGTRPELVHIVGMSLGAHVAGFAGSGVRSGRVARITGLDPAGPLFFLRGPSQRLDPTDAEFVDVIHTAAGRLGHFSNLGHVDFYPAGGVFQPNCSRQTISTRESCSHGRSLDYFSESIGNNNFYGYGCKSQSDLEGCSCDASDPVMMGEYLSTSARGVYYVEVNGRPNFSRGPLRGSSTSTCQAYD